MKTYIKDNTGWSAKDGSLVSAETINELHNRELTREARRSLMESVEEQSTVVLDASKVAELEAFYESKKPELKDGDDYQLIGVDLLEAGDSYSGILNCRVNGEHIQIRF
jgi:hypothetical protein